MVKIAPRILVIGPSWIGDMMMSQSLYRQLKQQQPERTIDVMAPAWCAPLLKRMPEVHQTVTMPLGHGQLALRERYRLGKSLRAHGYQQAIILPNSFKSALIPFFAHIPQRTGWRGEARYGLLNDLRPLDKSLFTLMVSRYLALAYDKTAASQAADFPPSYLWPTVVVSDIEQEEQRQQYNLRAERPIIGFCPGAEFGPAKRWPHFHYAALAQRLVELGYQIVLFGSAKDKPTGQQIVSALDTSTRSHCLDLTGRTSLDQAVILLACCHAVVTNDSGLMHVAAALKRPLVALYGPSSPDFTPPLAQAIQIIRLATGYHKVRSGDMAHGYHADLVAITPTQVERALTSLLNAV